MTVHTKLLQPRYLFIPDCHINEQYDDILIDTSQNIEPAEIMVYREQP